MASLMGDPWKIVSVSIFGAALVLLYSASTLYHSLRGRAKTILRKLDHLSIYLLIAGTYTPFCLVTLRGAWGWSILGAVWGLGLIGMLQEIKPRSEARVLSVVIYAIMGWTIVVALGPLLDRLQTAGFVWLAVGGAAYTIGIIFYAFDSRFRHWHGIWHLFVIGGSLCHYVAIAGYVI
jgi:hemolysin III